MTPMGPGGFVNGLLLLLLVIRMSRHNTDIIQYVYQSCYDNALCMEMLPSFTFMCLIFNILYSLSDLCYFNSFVLIITTVCILCVLVEPA